MRRILLPACILLAAPLAADTYTRQPAVDVLHYALELELSDSSDAISARARLHVRMRRDNVERMWLDFAGMEIDRFAVAGQEQPYEMKDGRLSFAFGRPYRSGEIAVVEVRYHGRPGERGLLAGKNAYGRRVFFAENWPDSARYWFPAIDHPSDKATVEMAVTAPERYEVVANGRLVETRSLLDGRKLTRWVESVPIPTYCMVFGAAEYSVTYAGYAANVPVLYYAYPQDDGAAARKFERTKLALSYLSDLIGPYPYEKLAQVQSTTRIGGMENSSNIFYSEKSFQKTPVSESPVPHEIVHQWFGDSVTPADWDHLWISEGFATYFDALFYAHLEGPEALRTRMARAAEAVKKYHALRPKPIIDPELTDLNKKLNAFNYQKGAWVLHMLRKILGDRTFFDGIRRFYAFHRDGNALTEDFQRVMEAVSGMSLESFFRQWFYQPGWPEYEVAWRWDEPAGEVEILIRQVQRTGLFDMPLDIVVRLAKGAVRQSVPAGAAVQTCRIAAPERPAAVEIDPEGWVLKSVTEVPWK